MAPVWAQAAAYLQLALSIDQHLPGFADAYFGPPEHRQAVRKRGQIPLEELAAVATHLLASVTSDGALEPDRRNYLAAQLAAMHTVVEILAGESLPIDEEARRLYGVNPAWCDESIFLDAHKTLEEILPGDGALAARCHAFELGLEVPHGEMRPIVREVAREFRRRARARLWLPAGETCEFRFVRGKPWYAFNHYRGNFASRVELNLDVPLNILWLPLTLAHEAYPGHHAESVIKEQKLVQELGRLEHSLQIKNSPASILSEGIANTALSVLTTPDELVEIYASLMQPCGLPRAGARRGQAYVQARRVLGRVRTNCILLAYRDGRPDAEILAYSKRYALIRENEAQMSLRYVKDPLRRSYGFIYPLGEELVRRFVFADADPWPRFARLLEAPAIPDQLERWIEATGPA